MALYAEVRKMDEDDEMARYEYVDAEGLGSVVLLNKKAETFSLESGFDDILYRAVVAKIAAIWLDSGTAPDHVFVQ
ncbi:hypothetical protein [Nocardia sp. NPDC051570]|uniref:hypothetical protein n=1 Tax=Nocardia sp. NPDC051570 TaxID=3364324 RepID=UPI00378E971A